MKKRILTCLLAAVLLFSCVPSASSAADIFFVAYNDTVPLTLSTEDGLLGYRDVRLAPHMAFTVNGMDLTPAYDAENRTMTLYSRTKRLQFDLAKGHVTDELGNTTPTVCAYRNQVIFLPVDLCAAHFGFTVSVLSSKEGYSVLRFCNGQQSYDDAVFIEKAENLIAYRVQRYLDEQSGRPPEIVPPVQEDPDPPTTDDPPLDPDRVPPTVYLAVVGAACNRDTLTVLKQAGIPAVFFLTAEEIMKDPPFVRAVRALDFPIGITVKAGELSAEDSLRAANDALDETIQMKTLLALLSQEQQSRAPGYFAADPSLAVTAEEAAVSETECLVICSDDITQTLHSLQDAEPKYRRLRETSPF